ncbi:hypothetical protein ACTXT7_017241, partial [Hymenolepis weldensis]
CNDVLRKDLADILEEEGLRLLFRRVEIVVHKNLRTYMRPKQLDNLKLKEAVSVLCEIFGKKPSESRMCFKCLTLTKRPDEVWISDITQTNKNLEQSDF